MGPEQQCTRCGVWYPLTSFSRSRARKSGRQAWCKFCAARYAAARKAVTGRTGRPGAPLRANPAPRCAERSLLFCEIPLDLKQEVVTACAADGVTLVSIVCEVLEDWLLSREGAAA